MLLPEDFGKIIVARKPAGAYFGTRARPRPRPTYRGTSPRTPEIVSFRVGVPPGYECWPLEQVRRYFRVLLDHALDELRAQRARENLEYLGVDAVLAQSHLDRPGPVINDGSLNPRIACAGDPLLLYQVLLALGTWKIRYRAAYENLREGRRAVFPPGTWGRHRFPRAIPLPRAPDP